MRNSRQEVKANSTVVPTGHLGTSGSLYAGEKYCCQQCSNHAATVVNELFKFFRWGRVLAIWKSAWGS